MLQIYKGLNTFFLKKKIKTCLNTFPLETTLCVLVTKRNVSLIKQTKWALAKVTKLNEPKSHILVNLEPNTMSLLVSFRHQKH